MDKEYFDLTNPQKSIWNIEKYYEGLSINNIPAQISIKSKVNIDLLAKAIQNTVEKNQAFNLRIKLVDGKPVQFVSTFAPFDIEIIKEKNRITVDTVKQNVINHKFNVLNNPLFLFKIFISKNETAEIIFVVHHIIADSWSLGLFARNIIQEYCALNDLGELPESNYSYLDFVESEKSYIKSLNFQKDKEFWKQTFSNVPESCTLPYTLTNADSFSVLGKRKTYTLNSKFINSINLFLKEHKLSMFNFLLSTYAYYISSITGLSQFVLGTPILNRTNYKEKQSMGMFVNTIPVYFDVQKSQDFLDLVKNTSLSMLQVLKHQKYSYTRILEDLRQNNSSVSGLYNILISYQITKAKEESPIDYNSSWLFNGYNACDISIHITDLNLTGEFEISYDYLTSKYTEKYIDEIQNRIINIISQVINSPEIELDKISIITDEEQNKILNEFNNTKTYYEQKTILDLFEENVKSTPYNNAIIFEKKALTYQELNSKANALADYLIQHRIKNTDTVAIVLERSFELIISMWAVIKSGAQFVIIDPEYPRERIDYIVKDSNAKFIISQINPITSRSNINITTFDYEAYSTDNPEVEYNSNLCIIYTSGSTGNPKGVLLHKEGYYNLLNAFETDMNISQYKKVLGIANSTFDMFAFEVFCSTVLGNTLILANSEEQKNPILMSKLIKAENVEFIVTTPSRADLLLKEECKNPLKNVKAMLLGGETFTPNLYNRLSKSTDAKIYNSYGPTEITSACTNKLITSDKITVGKPLPNIEVYICDSTLKLLPIGIVGEICVGGKGVTNGYLNNEEMTKMHFFTNPFSAGDLYKTGDLGKYNEDGEIEFVNRIDNQIKLHGLRIELGEIESKIIGFDGIINSVVTKITNEKSEYLCGYFTANDEVNIPKLRLFLSGVLPKYMVPSYLIQIDELPMTQNGKIDKTKLPHPLDLNIEKEIIEARNDTDKLLLSILEDLLSIKHISIEDSFFEIGGDSLSAINLTLEIHSKFNKNISIKDIFNNPIIRDLSDLIKAKPQIISEDTGIQKIEESDFYDASSAQKRIYISSQIAGSSLLYNISGGIIVDGYLDTKKLSNAIQELIERHESLRTYFENKDNNLIQKIKKKIDFKLDVSKGEKYDNLNELYKKFVKPFDLSKAPLFNCKYIEFTNKKSVIFLNIHHIISDGESMKIFAEELCKLYNGEKLNKTEFTYKDYSNFENNKSFEDDKKYWLQKFEDTIPLLNLPTTYSRPTTKSYDGNKVYSNIDSKTAKEIKDYCKRNNITPFTFLLACYYIILSRYSSQDDIVIGVPVANRDNIKTRDIFGMFVNTLAIREKINNNIEFSDFAESLQKEMIENYKHSSYPFDDLVNNLRISRDSSRSPLFDVMFIYQNNGLTSYNFEGLKTEYYIPDLSISKFDLSLEVIPKDRCFDLSFEYSNKLFSAEYINKFASHFINIINTIVSNSDIKLSKISMITNDELQTILNVFNNTKIYYEQKTILDLFEENSKNNPDSTAITFKGKRISYKTLNEKANCLANYLIQKNISSDDTIAILLDRSFELITSIWATIKSGAQFVIIDTEYPIDRINYILENSNSKYIITKSNTKPINIENIIDISKFNYEVYNSENPVVDYNSSLCIIYTSGSTGNPKGVLLHKEGYYNLLQAFETDMNISQYKNMLSIASSTFDMFAFEVLCATTFGNNLVLADSEEQKNPIAMSKLIKNENVDFMVTTPSRVEFLLKEECKNPLENVKAILFGGESFTENLYNRLEKVTKAKIYNSYGPTEITSACTNKLITSSDITVGKPLPNTEVYICDSNLNLLPIGIVGEICVGGKGVANGYLNNEEITRKHFLPNPFNSGTLYRTGDLGKYREDGEIEFVNRMDNQIKLRGLRIELGEIESLLLKYPNIKKSAVVKQELNNREFLSAYYVADKKIKIPELRKYLSRFLPKYMVPSYYTAMFELPYTANGKVDRKQLPIPKNANNMAKEDYELPKTKLEKQLVAIWENTLGIKPIGIHDNFFELGGDSLLAMNLNMEILKITDKITYADIFQFPTIFELEKKISSEENKLIFKKMENLPEENIAILDKTMKSEKPIEYHPKNILLTGATGFLGIHILNEFIKNETGRIYCIVRDEPGIKADQKLQQKLSYYFGSDYNNLIGDRIILVTGNIQDSDFGLSPKAAKELANNIDVVIHSAAIVTHFGNYNDFFNSNVQSTKYIINFCQKYNKKLYHISTTGVAGVELDMSFLATKKNKPKKIKFDESSLYIGQVLDNVYMRSKFEAENYVLSAISRGLDAYILRMGNLMPRYSDGMFQENILDNAFLMKMATFTELGIMPKYMEKHILNFTPVDFASKAIYKLVTHPSQDNRVFHLYNNKNITVKKYLRSLKNSDLQIDILDEEEFTERINSILKNDEVKGSLNNIIDDLDKQLHLNYVSDIITMSKFTVKYLRKLHFSWPIINTQYLDKFNNILRRAN